VVVAIIGVLIAFLLLTVQVAREVVRQFLCVNHLKQIEIGIHNFHNTCERLPLVIIGHPVLPRYSSLLNIITPK
jgi:hypothetical protein